MNQNSVPARGMKVKVLLLAVLAGSMLLFSFRAYRTYADFWQQLGITRENGTGYIKESFMSGYLQFWGARNMKNIALGDRAAVTKDLLTYTRQFVESDAFKKEYAARRLQNKPAEPAKPKTAAEVRAEQIESLKKSQAELEKGMKTAKEDMKKIFQESYDQITAMIKDYEKPDNDVIKLMAQGEQSTYEYRFKEYQEATKAWQEKYPEDSRGFIKARLLKMLDATKDVDFNAELTTRNNKQYFVNPVYESKPGNWKYAFRAGKEVTATARAFAQEWLKSL